MEQQNNFKYIFTGLVLLCAVLFSSWYFFNLYREKAFFKSSASLREKIGTGRYDFDSTLKDIEGLLEHAPNEVEASRATFVLSAFLFNRNQADDRERAFHLLDSLGDNKNLPKIYQALSIAEIANLFASISDFSEMKEIVGGNEPYSSFLLESNDDPRLAARRIFEYSNSIYPTALAHLEVAMINASRLMNGEHELGVSDAELASQIQSSVRVYASKIDERTRNGEIYLYTNPRRSLMYMLAGISLGVSERYLHNVDYSEIESLMKRSIDLGDEFSNQRVVALQADTARLYYAASLWSRFGEAKLPEINDVLLPVYKRKLDAEGDRMHVEFIENAGKQRETFLTERLVEVAKRIPEFRDYLASYGWDV